MPSPQVDQKGAIDLHEADAMLRMVYASRKADPLLLKQIDINGDGEVSMEELQQSFESLCAARPLAVTSSPFTHLLRLAPTPRAAPQ